ncbi:MAG: hypothetical protein GX108_05600 [Thermovirga sp.]|jgi:hypothetical protein|nr:hypothetical protein [Thermovirga sp.]
MITAIESGKHRAEDLDRKDGLASFREEPFFIHGVMDRDGKADQDRVETLLWPAWALIP